MTLLSDIACVKVVGEAESAADALPIVESLKPDLVLLDWESDGAREGQSGLIGNFSQDTPVVVLTDYRSENTVARCLALGATAVFDKAIDTDHLLDFVSNICASNQVASNTLQS